MRALRGKFAAGLLAAALALCAGPTALNANNTRDRTISFFAINTKETLTIQYMKDGKHIPEAMDKINWIMRDWRRDQKITIEPSLIDLVWEIHEELGSQEPIHIICGYRSRDTNEMLRRTVGGQASQSRHILGKAIDVMFPDVPLKRLRYSALLRERGGVGYYPTSGIPFVHLDTDRVRAWPRATRAELALLFPNGRTQHMPADGGPLTPNDVRAASANKELATEMAEFHQVRTTPRPVQVASLGPALPQLVGAPRPAERPMGLGTRPSEADRASLAALAAEPPRLVGTPQQVRRPAQPAQVATRDAVATELPARRQTATQAALQPASHKLETGVLLPAAPVFVTGPSIEDEHYDDLSFQLFPAGPLLTATASPDDPSLVRLIHPFDQELRGSTMSIASFIEGEAEAARNLATLPNTRVSSRTR